MCLSSTDLRWSPFLHVLALSRDGKWGCGLEELSCPDLHSWKFDNLLYYWDKYDAEVEGVPVHAVTVFCPLCALATRVFVKYKVYAIFWHDLLLLLQRQFVSVPPHTISTH